METLEYCLVTCLFQLELMAAGILYMLPLSKKDGFPVRASLCTIFSCLPILLYDLSLSRLTITSWENSPFYVLYFLISLFLLMLSLLICCNINYNGAFRYSTFAYATQHFAYCLHRALFKVEDPRLLSQYSFGYIVVYMAVYLLAYFQFARPIAKLERGNSITKLSLLHALCTLSVTLMLSTKAQHFEAESRMLYTITLLYAMFCCFFLLMNHLQQLKLLDYQNKLIMKERLWAEKKAQYELSKESISLINQKCHDLKHQIHLLRTMPDGERKENHLNDIEMSVIMYDAVVQTGNEVVDTVLTEKSLICEQNHILLTCMVDGQSLDFIDSIDLYTIFGNALDNAIESVSRLTCDKQRIISISAFSRVGLVFLQFENYYAQEIERNEKGLFSTTKDEKEFHGFGLSSIQQTVERYGGFLTLETENNIFMLRISIPQGK